MNESKSFAIPRSPARWVAPMVEELGALSDLTLQAGSPDPQDCVPEDPSSCEP